MFDIWIKNQAELAGVQPHVLCTQDDLELAVTLDSDCSLAGVNRPLNYVSGTAVDFSTC